MGAPLWALGLRKAPKLTPEDIKACTVLSMLHTVGQVGAVVAMSAGSVSFTHIIKALEPMFSVIFGILINGTSDPLKVNIWLVPIILGVRVVRRRLEDYGGAGHFGGHQHDGLR